MPEFKKPFHIRWAGPNTPYIRFFKGDKRIYLSKRELVALVDEIDDFTNYYRECFMKDRIDAEDIVDDIIDDINIYANNEEHTRLEEHRKWVYELARKAGFDDDAFAYTEPCLLPFFNLIVEECAKIAEKQAILHNNTLNEATKCHSTAFAIRLMKEE